MVIDARLKYLQDRDLAGDLIIISILSNGSSGAMRIKVLVWTSTPVTSSLIRSIVWSSLDFLQNAISHLDVVDRGHKHFHGTYEIGFWIKAQRRHMYVSSDTITTGGNLSGAWQPLDSIKPVPYRGSASASFVAARDAGSEATDVSMDLVDTAVDLPTYIVQRDELVIESLAVPVVAAASSSALQPARAPCQEEINPARLAQLRPCLMTAALVLGLLLGSSYQDVVAAFRRSWRSTLRIL